MAIRKRARLDDQNRVTIPHEVLLRLGIEAGDEVEIEQADDGLCLRSVSRQGDPVARAYGFLAARALATADPDLEEMARRYRASRYTADDDRIRRTGA